ncbi:hypothetical protein F5Y19DRAFT_491332 [Xylariaceae sp. FL1651]|nr:hypothetical protein F5Y19DRAFT_491332 [Xylariaceae sp. FL1651]
MISHPSRSFVRPIVAISLLRYGVAVPLTNDSTIYRDVAIIGGGASGTHATIALNDAGLSTITIEASSGLGGPTQVYTDPNTNTTIDFGSQAFQNIPATQRYMKRLNLKTDDNFVPWGAFFNQSKYFNFNEGKEIVGFEPLDNIWTQQNYNDSLQPYPELQWGKELKSPVPEELYLPFGEFVKKHGLENIIFGLNNVYTGDNILEQPTLNVISDSGLAEIRNWLPGGALRVVTGNGQVYRKAVDVIGPNNILFESTVTKAVRGNHGASLWVKTPKGTKHIIAKRLLVTIPTIAEDMEPFGIDAHERKIFSSFSAKSLWIGIFRIPNLPDAVSYVNADAGRPYNLTPVYGDYRILPTAIDGLYTTYFNGNTTTSDEEAIASALNSVSYMVKGLKGVSQLAKSEKPEVVITKRVYRWTPGMHADAIKRGMWDKMYALQGTKSTWYTGATFMPGSHQLWNYTDTVLVPEILSSIRG